MSTEIRHNFNYGILYTLIFSFSICNLIINIIFFVSFIIMPASFDIIPRFFTGIGRLARIRTRFGIRACRAEIADFSLRTVKTFARYFYPGAFFIYKFPRFIKILRRYFRLGHHTAPRHKTVVRYPV